MKTARLTAAQAVVRYLASQRVLIDGQAQRLFEGVWAIFGHGNVTGLGQALFEAQDNLPTYRAHNEQAMAHAAVAFSKANRRRRMMACTTSIGPGASNLVTAAAGAHINRLPVLLLPGDTFATRAPDPVLQQLELASDPSLTVNECLRPVSRYFDRIQRPEQLIAALPQALRVLTDPAECGPVTLALPQDVQTEAYDYPLRLFEPGTHSLRRPRPDRVELARAIAALQQCTKPLIIAGGGILYSQAERSVAALAERIGAAVATTQAGHGCLAWSHPNNVGGLGVTGTGVANALAREADVVIAVGTRLSDFTTASGSLFNKAAVVLSINVTAFDASKYQAVPVVADAKEALQEMLEGLKSARPSAEWGLQIAESKARWQARAAGVCMGQPGLPSDAQVLSAVNRAASEPSVVVCAAGGLPGELHKLYEPAGPGSYHVEYGYSCMGYEIAGGLGVKMADPEREVFVLVGDGSYLMMNSELATAVSMGAKLIVVLLDNHGFGCIHRLQTSSGSAAFNNLRTASPDVDYVLHARALGAHAEKVTTVAALETALVKAKGRQTSSVIVIETDPNVGTTEGGAWWQVPIGEVSEDAALRRARDDYEAALRTRDEG